MRPAGVLLAVALCSGAVSVAFAVSLPTRGPVDPEVKFVAVRGSGDKSTEFGLLGEKISGKLARKAHSVGVDYAAYGVPYPAASISVWKMTNVQLPQYRLSVRGGRNKLYGYIRE